MAARTIVLGLDAFEPTVARALIAEGRLPHLAALAARSARFDLDHGPERYTGLAWHQLSTGLHPRQSGRWSSIQFDPKSYDVAQPLTDEPPFTQGLGVRSVAFDVPHFDIPADPLAAGIANWGCHDAGVPRTTRPEELWQEVEERFGPYPDPEHIYGIVWSSPDDTRRMGEGLVGALATRTDMVTWLLTERIRDWELAIIGIPEFHSVIETMWHGWATDHPLHHAPSAAAARAALVAVYEAGDRMVGAILDRFPEADVVAVAPHGMGSNTADAAAMILVAELLFRHSQGVGALEVGEGEQHQPHRFWSGWVNGRLSFPEAAPTKRNWLKGLFGTAAEAKPVGDAPTFDHELDWMPTARYRRFWPRMKAFALPSYHDARIRLNVAGREARGIVAQRNYATALAEIRDLLAACVDIESGRALDIEVDFTDLRDPMAVTRWQTDVVVRFKRNVLGLFHPTYGRIGPVPHRRTGGHTGGYGLAWIAAAGILPGAHGVASTFDVVPAIRALVAGKRLPPAMAKASGDAPALASAE